MTGIVGLTLACAWTECRAQDNVAGQEGSVPAELRIEAEKTLTLVKRNNPALQGYFRQSAGYVIFPTITEASLVLGGAHGKGLVYQNGKLVGEATVTKVTVGPQAGGQTFSELIFFETPALLNAFKAGNYQFSAEASAVIAEASAGAALEFREGVAVFTFDRTGLMAQAAIGGQKFAYRPVDLKVGGGGSVAGGRRTEAEPNRALGQQEKTGPAEAQQTVTALKQKNPALDSYFRQSAGYAIFPNITEASLVVGGAHGNGLVYQNGKLIGEATVTKVTVGAQAGGQTYSEVIFFETPQSLQRFQAGNFQVSAESSAVAEVARAGEAPNFREGVAVFTFDRNGVMAQAAVGGQKFSYQPIAVGQAGSATSGTGAEAQPDGDLEK